MSRLTALNYHVPYWKYHNKYRLVSEIEASHHHTSALMVALDELANITGRLTCLD